MWYRASLQPRRRPRPRRRKTKARSKQVQIIAYNFWTLCCDRETNARYLQSLIAFLRFKMHLFGSKHVLDPYVNIPVSWYVYIPVCVCVHCKYLRTCKYTGMCVYIHAYSPQTCNVYAHTHSNSPIDQNKSQNVGTDFSECKSCTTRG